MSTVASTAALAPKSANSIGGTQQPTLNTNLHFSRIENIEPDTVRALAKRRDLRGLQYIYDERQRAILVPMLTDNGERPRVFCEEDFWPSSEEGSLSHSRPVYQTRSVRRDLKTTIKGMDGELESEDHIQRNYEPRGFADIDAELYALDNDSDVSELDDLDRDYPPTGRASSTKAPKRRPAPVQTSFQTVPAMITEIGDSEASEVLRAKAFDWLWGSDGQVQLVMLINLQRPKNRKDRYDRRKWTATLELWKRSTDVDPQDVRGVYPTHGSSLTISAIHGDDRNILTVDDTASLRIRLANYLSPGYYSPELSEDSIELRLQSLGRAIAKGVVAWLRKEKAQASAPRRSHEP